MPRLNPFKKNLFFFNFLIAKFWINSLVLIFLFGNLTILSHQGGDPSRSERHPGQVLKGISAKTPFNSVKWRKEIKQNKN